MRTGMGDGVTHTAEAAAQRPRAYSYTRFSTPAQAEGDSARRQIDRARAYAKAHDLQLDTDLTFEDLGVSAYRDANVQTGRLGEFLKAVEAGLIPPGSFLLVESLDRISRNKPRKAFRLLEQICEAGVTVVTTVDERRYDEATLDDDPMALMYALMVAIRANEESERKADRVGNAYSEKRKAAAEGNENGTPFTRMLPAWIEWREDIKKYAVIPERGKVVETIFRMAEGGLGQHAIAQRLNAQGVPTFGGRGNQRKADAWHRSYIKKLLTHSAVVGTFTPHQKHADAQGKRKRVPLDPIEGYFPPVIDRDLFERVASRMRATAPRGRNAIAEPKSLFAGLLRCARCRGTVTRMSKGKGNVYLICSRANRRLGCEYQAVRYEDVEHALLENAPVIMQEAPRGQEAAEIEQQITNLDIAVSLLADEARELVDELIRDKSNAKRAALREKERELEHTRERLRALRAHRDTLATPYVARRLQALEKALTRKPLNVVEANNALKEAVSRIVINPEAAELTLYWHHAPDQPTEAGPFQSRHYTGFDDNKEG